MSNNYQYNHQFKVREPLTDGATLIIRRLQPEDKPLLSAGLSELSLQSQYMRFFGPKPELTANELKYLTEMDGETHFALIGFYRNQTETYGASVARFVRLAEDETVAEPAIVVLDRFHSMGIGTYMLYHLHLSAYERGIRWFEAEFLAENEAMRILFERFSENVVYDNVDAHTIRVRVPVLSPDGNVPKTSGQMMAETAVGKLQQNLKRFWE